MPSQDEIVTCRCCGNPLRKGIKAIGVCEECVYNEVNYSRVTCVPAPSYKNGKKAIKYGDEPCIE